MRASIFGDVRPIKTFRCNLDVNLFVYAWNNSYKYISVKNFANARNT